MSSSLFNTKQCISRALHVHKGRANARKFFTPATAPSYDTVVRITTFGRDAGWKRRILDLVTDGRQGPVLDLACGTGILSRMVRGRGRPVAGLDLASGYLEIARQRMGPALAQGTAEVLPYRDGIFDAVVSSYLTKYVDVQAVVAECWRVLAPGGIAVFHDFTCPESVAVRCLWSLYFAILKLAGVFAKSWKPVFDDLDRVITESRWVEDTVKAMQERGFQGVDHRRYTLGTAAIVWGRKP